MLFSNKYMDQILLRLSPFGRRCFITSLVILSIPLMYTLCSSSNEVFSGDDETMKKNDTQVLQHLPRVRFIPYPHRTLGSGNSLRCKWETKAIAENSTFDFTQRNAYMQGICMPPTLKDKLHIFSSAEAIECLSPGVQNRDIKLYLSGDSYIKQLHIGLVDILLSKHISNDFEPTNSTERNTIVLESYKKMAERLSKEPISMFPIIHFTTACYGSIPLNKSCSESVKTFDESGSVDSDYVHIIGSGVHIYKRRNQVNATIHEIVDFLDTSERTIFVSPPFYYPHAQFSDKLVRDQAKIYEGLLPHVNPTNSNSTHPCLDVYELTKSCEWENCSYDKAHRSRFVNRWKAQLLLNILCEVR